MLTKEKSPELRNESGTYLQTNYNTFPPEEDPIKEFPPEEHPEDLSVLCPECESKLSIDENEKLFCKICKWTERPCQSLDWTRIETHLYNLIYCAKNLDLRRVA